MKIKIREDELYPFYEIIPLDRDEGVVCDIHEDTVERWKTVAEVFFRVQREMVNEMKKGDMNKIILTEKCEICKEIATYFVNDLFKKANFTTGCWEYKEAGSHQFCGKHKREPVIVDISCTPLNS